MEDPEQLVQLENLEPVAGPEAEEADLADQGHRVHEANQEQVVQTVAAALTEGFLGVQRVLAAVHHNILQGTPVLLVEQVDQELDDQELEAE